MLSRKSITKLQTAFFTPKRKEKVEACVSVAAVPISVSLAIRLQAVGIHAYTHVPNLTTFDQNHIQAPAFAVNRKQIAQLKYTNSPKIYFYTSQRQFIARLFSLK